MTNKSDTPFTDAYEHNMGMAYVCPFDDKRRSTK